MRHSSWYLSVVLLAAGVAVAAADDAPYANPMRAAILRRHGITTAAATPTTPEQIVSELLAGNRRFASGAPRAATSPDQRRELVAGQHPQAIVLGCSDSRVSPELLFDQGLGQLSVMRTAGAIADDAARSSIEHAVSQLHTKVVVVLGHDHCDELVELSAEANARRQAEALAQSPGLAEALHSGELKVIAAVYHMASGEVEVLE